MFACWRTYGYFNVFSNNVNKKMTKKALFLATENAEIFLDRIDTVFFRHGSVRQAQDRLTRIHTDSSIVSNHGYLWHKLHGFLSQSEIRDWLFEKYHPLCSLRSLSGCHPPTQLTEQINFRQNPNT